MQQMKVKYSDYFSVDSSAGETTVRFEVHTILDAATIQDVADDLYALADQHGLTDLVLDMAGVRFLSSQTLGTLVNLQRKCRVLGGKVVLTGVAPTIARMFRITRLDTLLTVREQPDATQECSGPGGCALAPAGPLPGGYSNLAARPAGFTARAVPARS